MNREDKERIKELRKEINAIQERTKKGKEAYAVLIESVRKVVIIGRRRGMLRVRFPEGVVVEFDPSKVFYDLEDANNALLEKLEERCNYCVKTTIQTKEAIENLKKEMGMTINENDVCDCDACVTNRGIGNLGRLNHSSKGVTISYGEFNECLEEEFDECGEDGLVLSFRIGVMKVIYYFYPNMAEENVFVDVEINESEYCESEPIGTAKTEAEAKELIYKDFASMISGYSC